MLSANIPSTKAVSMIQQRRKDTEKKNFDKAYSESNI